MKNLTLLLMPLALSSLSFAGPILYAIDDANNSLLTIDRSTYAISVVGSTGVATGDFGDLTYDSNGGTMYWTPGRGNNALYTIDLNTGAATLVGATGLNDLFGLAYDTANDTLYGATSGGSLYSIDTTTGAPTLIGSNAVYTGGLAYRSDTNTLYEYAAGGGQLYSLNPSNGAATQLSAGPGYINDGGITWDPILGLWWVNDWSGNVYQVNAAFTSSNTVQTYSDALDGIALVGASSTTPEPATISLIAVGLGLAALLRRRRSDA